MAQTLDRRPANRRRVLTGVATVAAVAGLLVTAAPAAMAGSKQACNAAFCNRTTGSGSTVSTVTATKVGANRGVVGFFEVFIAGKNYTGPTTSADVSVLTLNKDVGKSQVCLRFFARTTGGGFVEVGTAQCTKAPY